MGDYVLSGGEIAAMAVIDNFGRRKLMIVGSIGYIVSLGATGIENTVLDD